MILPRFYVTFSYRSRPFIHQDQKMEPLSMTVGIILERRSITELQYNSKMSFKNVSKRRIL